MNHTAGKILVVDDDDMFRSMLSATLRSSGYEVIEAENGKVAMKMVHDYPVDLVVTDLIMPDQEGIETIKEIKRFYPDMKIIAVSGGMRGGSMDFLPIAEYMGAARSFKKPIDRKAFLAAVAELISA